MTTDSVNQVQDVPQDVQVKAGEADIAIECQARPSSLDDAHKVQEEKRKKYETNSSQSLPRVLVLDGEADKSLFRSPRK